MKKNYTVLLLLFSLLAYSCSSDSEKPLYLPVYSLEAIQGYSYSTTFTSSSGNELSPELTIYDSKHLCWNMSTSMGAVNFFYIAEKDSFLNVWTLYWFSSEASMESRDTSKALMAVKIGINSYESISLLVFPSSSSSSMSGTSLTMNLSSFVKKTYTSSSNSSESQNEEEIRVSGSSCDWFEDSSTFNGTFTYSVSGSQNGSNNANLLVRKTSTGKVSVTIPSYSAMGYTIESYQIEGVNVTKDTDTYYLSIGECSVNSGSYVIHIESFAAKYKDGVFSSSLIFRPGAMPLSIKQVFRGNK